MFTAGDLRGHGSVQASGGRSKATKGGGGAGGRIALYSNYDNQYRGHLVAIGESGPTGGDRGGPGTVFIEDATVTPAGKVWKGRLYVDGQNLWPAKPVVLNERNPLRTPTGNHHLQIDQLLLERKVGDNFIHEKNCHNFGGSDMQELSAFANNTCSMKQVM